MSKNRKARHKKKTKEVVRDAVYRDKQEAQTASYSTRSSNRIITKKSKLNWVEKSLINSVGEPLIDRAPFIPVNQWFLLGQGLLGTAFFIKDGDWEGLWVILFIALSYLFLVTPIKYSVILGPYGRL
ncbi:hypothetical protein GCM10009007_05050 [Formosimonas limnophila]|uniref:Uncharacterized protein n=1 Tax=Formosimonas limnophila TaxID=1384487 RepID=A0A8J3CG80_9BURK|nr:hypothetical protein [Formosimonas limnophila]GHA67418.1 hypothetical protein GCM10009007_05050 [Formosimonas limnophila]